jgi:predicted DNA-binding ribbon-helix-helix protein
LFTGASELDAIDYWTNVVLESAEIDALHVARYVRAPQFPEGLGMEDNYRALADEARQGALRDNRPFWDVLLRLAARKGELTDDLLARASKSHPREMDLFSIAASEIRIGALRRLVNESAEGEVCVMASKVSLVSGQMKHFPMMDLRCEVGAMPLRSVEQLANWLLPGGYSLFASGRSYHLVGTELISGSSLSNFLVRSLYAGDLVDRKYITHHLERGFCTLRISSSGQGGVPDRIQP